MSINKRSLQAAIFVSALGYLVDVYDLILFSAIRVPSLKDLGLSGEDLLDQGLFLLNMQLFGLLLGGILWGVVGDQRGRVSVLFGSILLYSLANVANGFVYSIEAYAVCRFIAGIGLAGELGAGITLVSEVVSKERRGYATTFIATLGMLGGVLAAYVGSSVYWRHAFFIGGGMGLVLLFLRVAVHESGMFKAVSQTSTVRRGDFLCLFKTRERLRRYLSCILIGLPVYFALGIQVTAAPELGKALGMAIPPAAAMSVFYWYIGLAIGDLGSGLISQWLQSRRQAILIFMVIGAGGAVWLLGSRGMTPEQYYATCVVTGVGVGYWAVFVTTAAEQFGTNLRATVATTVPNFVRGSGILVTWSFNQLRQDGGPVWAASCIALTTFLVAAVALYSMRETYGRDLDFVEEV